MNYVIRKMEKRDKQAVQLVARASWNSTYEGIIPLHIQDLFLEAAYSDKMLDKRMEQTHLYVAEIDGKVVGFANFTSVQENGEAELGAIYLYEEYQGQGIGTALLQEGMKLPGIKKIYINVEKDNEIGKNFYKAKGFEVVEAFDDDLYGHITKMLRMVLDIS